MKLMADGVDGPASDGQECVNQPSSPCSPCEAPAEVQGVSDGLGTDCLAPCFWLCGNHRGTITAHHQMSPDFKLMPANGYEACLEGFLSYQVPRTP